ncbi:hypothetical protein WA026_001982 [Henosepilachna vigintioctopunctata]|uniref:Uncharacterized protein n=1 Tax=Henosepilachna vigintioctopunctata TaxID=420089 RepID=A0AAW1UUX1_9CUCU
MLLNFCELVETWEVSFNATAFIESFMRTCIFSRFCSQARDCEDEVFAARFKHFSPIIFKLQLSLNIDLKDTIISYIDNIVIEPEDLRLYLSVCSSHISKFTGDVNLTKILGYFGPIQLFVVWDRSFRQRSFDNKVFENEFPFNLLPMPVTIGNVLLVNET